MSKTPLVLLGLFGLMLTINAATDSHTARNQLHVETIDVHTTRVTLNQPDWELGDVDLPQGHFQRIISDLPAEMRTSEAPSLPSSVVMIAVPETGDLTISYAYSQALITDDVDLAPFQPVQLENEFADTYTNLMDPEMGAMDVWYPTEPAVIHERAQMRDITVAHVEITPFQYNPARRQLRYLEGMEVNLEHSEPLRRLSRPASRMFEPIYQAIIPNYVEVMPENYQTPSILFITPNNSTVDLILANLISWKHEKGFEVHSANTSVTGSSNTAIKNYIQTAYDTWENPPEFVVLVGDAGGSLNIPTWQENWSSYHGEGDHPYITLAGSDYIGDAFVGRISISSTSQLSNIVTKTLNYERSPYVTDPAWFTRALLVGDPGSSGLSTVMTNRFIDEVTEQYGYSSNILVFNGSWVSQIANGINAGVSYFNYRGYLGMSGWGDSDTNGLNNGPKLPFATILTCGTGSFTGSARSEAFLRAGSVSVPKGAIGAVGTATTGTHTLYNNCVAGGIYQGIFNEHMPYAGQALERGRINLDITYPSNPSNYVQIFSHWNNLMGDPSVELWTRAPQILTITAPATLPATAEWLTVTVVDELGYPVEGAWITALQGDDVVFVSSYSNPDGIAVLDLMGLNLEDLTLTVTKHNFIPSQQTISVDSTTHPILLSASGFTETIGNGDGIANAGETFEFTFTVSNDADTALQNISLTATSEFGQVGEYTLTNLDAGATFTSNALPIAIPSDYAGIADVDVFLEIDANGTGWSDHRRLPVIGPFLEVVELSEPGTGATSFDPGEITDLVLDVTNRGRGDATGISAILHSGSPDVTVMDSTATFGGILAGADGDNSADYFSLELGSQLTVGVQVPMSVSFTDASGYTVQRQILIPVGTPTAGDPLGPDAGGYFCYDDGDLAYALAPIYNWIEIKPGEGGFAGTQVAINDHGENQEDIVNVTLPFAFGFYGLDYNEIGIGSNGYISLGASEVAMFRNYPMPGAMGPSPSIAGFWDDLVLGGDAGVYTYYHTALHYFVIEWFEMINRFDNNSLETFQIILYDPDYYGSTDGNGDVKIQWKEFNNVDVGTGWSSSHANYATVGIENETATVGLQYTYNNTYPVQAHVLSDESAVLFTTRTDAILPCPGWALSDVNHDGHRNVQDLVITVNVLLGSDTFGECQFWAADLSQDSSLTVGDLVMMVDQIIGLGRPAHGKTTGSAPRFSLDREGVHLQTDLPLGGFLVELRSEEEPRLNHVEGVSLTKSHQGSSWYILGYTTTAGIGDMDIASFDGSNAEFGKLDVAGLGGETIRAEGVIVPQGFAVRSVYPNPFNPVVHIQYDLPEAGVVRLDVFNALGQRIYDREVPRSQEGRYTLTWSGETDQAGTAGTGIYFARLTAGNRSQVVKLTLLK